MKYTFMANIYHEDNAYIVAFPDIPSCFTSGDTLEEAIAHLPDFRMDLIYQETGRIPVHYSKVILKITAAEIAALADVTLAQEGGRKNG